AGLMPAAEAMSRVVVAWKPFSANAITAASSRRARVASARERSGCAVIADPLSRSVRTSSSRDERCASQESCPSACLTSGSVVPHSKGKQALSHLERPQSMPEAVIVSTARSPIGRAVKGSLKDMRPDDLAVQMVRAALAKVPELDPAEVVDLVLGVGQPAGESGNNLGRAVAVLSGMDHLPGVTVNRYCSSSLQPTRMALHGI